ncbi:MAG: hypothetical protein A2Z17_04125 [Gammaproteobacteria bacterium RBG_16_66_13]|nr:MAG: hypothetical protein A2Z17_04125 [Gammaproteobacteria bacterium RBG_16_66_13]
MEQKKGEGNMKRFLSIAFLSVGLLALVGLVFVYLARPGAASTPTATPDSVAIQGYSFRPATLRVAVGTTVTWTNRDAVAHTVTGKSGNWGSELLAQGEQFSYTFTEAGTYDYFCEPHPSMEGRIVVGETTDEEATPTPSPTTLEERTEQMRQMMDAMHGSGSFDQMRQWMEERWGPGAFDEMLQNCPHAGDSTGQGMMGGGMMNGEGMMNREGMMDGQGMMGGGMMGGGMMGGGQ